MPTIEVTPFRAADAWALVPGSHTADTLSRLPNLDQAFQQYETAGPAWSCRVDGQLIGCAGLLRMWPGVAHGWFLASIAMREYPKTVLSLMRQHLPEVLATEHLIRLQAEVQTDFHVGRRFLEHLGFVSEGDMRRFGPGGETYTRYAWIREE